MNITLTDKGNLTKTIQLVVDSADYVSNYEAELSKKQKNTALKGFRQGKTPMSFVKKVYGNEILSNMINDLVMKSLQDYITENGIITIGSAIPSEDHKQVEVDYKNLGEYDFSFDIGIAPEFDIVGAQKDDSYVKSVPEIPESMIEEEITKMRKMFGKREQVKTEIEEGDYVMVHGYEQDGDSAKVAGKEVSFSFLVDDLEEEYQKSVLKNKIGEKLVVDIYNFEKGKTKEFVDKYILKLEEEEEAPGNIFELEIVEVSRIKEAELDQEFFDKVFRDKKIESLEAAKEEIKAQMSTGYTSNATNLMYREMMNHMMEANNFDLPEAFLERWLFDGKEITEEEKEKELKEALKEVKWSVMRSKLSKQFEVKVEESDIVNRARVKAGQMVNQYRLGADYLQEVTKHILQSEKEVQQIYLEVETEKMFAKLEEHVKVEEKLVSMEEYEKGREKIMELDKHQH